MDRLPEEVVLHILSFLEVNDIVRLQAVSTRYLTLARDTTLWKTVCFESSRAETQRRRQKLTALQPAQLALLREAVFALPSAEVLAAATTGTQNPDAAATEAKVQRARALANWEPGYPTEKIDYYEEFIHRHAPISVGWLDLPKSESSGERESWREATGLATLTDTNGNAESIVAPLDDGSVCLWSLSDGGKLLAQSKPGLLTAQPPEGTFRSHAMMTETGAVDCVALDPVNQKGYFAVQSLLHEVDLSTLQLVSTKEYPWPITALPSVGLPGVPVTVGTNWTVHLHDPRDPAYSAGGGNGSGGVDGVELIGGRRYSHVTLEQPGPTSILHPDAESIWIAGRFTSLLNYDRRFFPRLKGTVHSGARIASLSSLPFPLVPQDLNLTRNPAATISARTEAKERVGSTILAAGEYKGKGSLELFEIGTGAEVGGDVEMYKNRQTASASKLMAVAPHGGRVVFSDGDGNIKWMERDGFSHVRTFNINDAAPPLPTAGGPSSGAAGDASAYGIWSSTASEMPGQGDIVQKILPTHPVTASTTGSSSSTAPTGSAGLRPDTNTSNLLLWTGDGRLGVLGFGHKSPLGEAEGESEGQGGMEVEGGTVEERARGDAERQYGMAMRRALERNADEVRFVRGLGMGFSRG